MDDVEKLQRLIRYIHGTEGNGVVLRPGALGVTVRLYVDASYGVHCDGKSHTGSCVVIGDVGAVHCRSSKQLIVTKSSTEAELVGLSDSANQAIHIREFLIGQGYPMGPIIVYQDNQSCMALVERGRSGAERTRHQILLGEREGGHRRSAGGVPTDREHVCQCAYQATARSAVQERVAGAHWVGAKRG